MVPYAPYLYALYMASVDGFAMAMLKAKHLGFIKNMFIFPITMLIYSFQPLIFYKSLSSESMSIMNVLWDVMSDVIVALIGYFVFGEVFTIQQCIGIVFCVIGITLLGVK